MTATMQTSNVNAMVPCTDMYMMLTDSCAYEPVELVQHPTRRDATLEKPVVVAADEAALTNNAVNVVTSGIVKVVLFPPTPAEGDVFVLVNSTPTDLQVKNLATDTEPVARLRPATSVSMRFSGGKWAVY